MLNPRVLYLGIVWAGLSQQKKGEEMQEKTIPCLNFMLCKGGLQTLKPDARKQSEVRCKLVVVWMVYIEAASIIHHRVKKRLAPECCPSNLKLGSR